MAQWHCHALVYSFLWFELCSLKQDFENAVQSSLKKAVDNGFFCDKGQFYYGNKVNSIGNQMFACLGVSAVTINTDNGGSTVLFS